MKKTFFFTSGWFKRRLRYPVRRCRSVRVIQQTVRRRPGLIRIKPNCVLSIYTAFILKQNFKLILTRNYFYYKDAPHFTFWFLSNEYLLNSHDRIKLNRVQVYITIISKTFCQTKVYLGWYKDTLVSILFPRYPYRRHVIKIWPKIIENAWANHSYLWMIGLIVLVNSAPSSVQYCISVAAC